MNNSPILSITTNKERKFDIYEIYNESFVKIYFSLVDVITLFSISLTFLLIYAIIKKTPKTMKNLKIYLLPYAVYTIITDLVYALYIPLFLHPFLIFYPGGLAKNFSKDFQIIIVGCGTFSAIALLDCCIGLALERFFALRNIEKINPIQSKIPSFIFILLTLSSLFMLFIGIICVFIKPFLNNFLVPKEEISEIAKQNINGIENVLDMNSLLIFRSSASNQNTIPYFVILGGLFASFKVIFAYVITLLNGIKSHKLKYLMTLDNQKSNAMLLRMSYFQFLGFFFILSFPVAIITFTYWFNPHPSIYVNYCLGIMNFFGLYDTLMTLICIRPYRIYVINLFKKVICKYTMKTVIIPSTVF